MNNTTPMNVNTPAEALQIAEALFTAVAGTVVPHQVGQAWFASAPAGYTQKNITDDVEKAQITPNRKRGNVKLKDLDSLLAYCADQVASERAYIYADPDTRVICAIFNDQRDPHTAGWRDHRAEFRAEFTPEFDRWMSRNGHGKAMSQAEFAEFIEDNLADITEPAAQQLLEVASTIQAKTDIQFSSAKRLDNGQVQLGYTETIDARAGANGALEIPREFALGLRIFKNGGGYRLRARLKYRLVSGGVKFWYELDRPERAVEDAFGGYVATLREKSGYCVLLGAA
ncbi:DUF2303 family protein [Hydrogenophaga sp.]|uniref:DUF2303 family protein n=1 Tax=Hydrogenophaga sp. TaxID=1904254 RepID=UPI00272FE087|nr:DUF2303 family protein [Hydrogenophaga sp.]MDP1686855.1 DUF2303 family protein [Hydrogenophaga sp.]